MMAWGGRPTGTGRPAYTAAGRYYGFVRGGALFEAPPRAVSQPMFLRTVGRPSSRLSRSPVHLPSTVSIGVPRASTVRIRRDQISPGSSGEITSASRRSRRGRALGTEPGSARRRGQQLIAGLAVARLGSWSSMRDGSVGAWRPAGATPATSSRSHIDVVQRCEPPQRSCSRRLICRRRVGRDARVPCPRRSRSRRTVPACRPRRSTGASLAALRVLLP